MKITDARVVVSSPGRSSWLTPADAVAAKDWDRITSFARQAATLTSSQES